MSGLAWLNELMLWLGKWFPRPLLIKAGHVGVWFSLGGAVKTLEPGLYVYWPITTDVTVVSTRRRTFEIASQLCDLEAVSLTVAFTIANPQAVLLAFGDVFSQLDDRTQAALSASYEATTDNGTLAGKVKAQLCEQFTTMGVTIHSVDVVGRGRVIPLKNLNDWAQHAKAELA